MKSLEIGLLITLVLAVGWLTGGGATVPEPLNVVERIGCGELTCYVLEDNESSGVFFLLIEKARIQIGSLDSAGTIAKAITGCGVSPSASMTEALRIWLDYSQGQRQFPSLDQGSLETGKVYCLACGPEVGRSLFLVRIVRSLERLEGGQIQQNGLLFRFNLIRFESVSGEIEMTPTDLAFAIGPDGTVVEKGSQTFASMLAADEATVHPVRCLVP